MKIGPGRADLIIIITGGGGGDNDNEDKWDKSHNKVGVKSRTLFRALTH